MLRRIEVRKRDENGDYTGEWNGLFREGGWHLPSRMTKPFGALFSGTPAPYKAIGDADTAKELLEDTVFYYTEGGWRALWEHIRSYLKEAVKHDVDVRIVHLSEDHEIEVVWGDNYQSALRA